MHAAVEPWPVGKKYQLKNEINCGEFSYLFVLRPFGRDLNIVFLDQSKIYTVLLTVDQFKVLKVLSPLKNLRKGIQ